MGADAITLASRVRPTGDAVLLKPKTGVYPGLDPVGTRIWHLLQEQRSLQAVLESLVEEYAVMEACRTQELLRLVALLREQGLVEVPDQAAT